MMEWDVFEFVILGLFGVGAFILKMLFNRLDNNARMLIDLHAKQAATHEQIVSLFKLADKLEAKVDDFLTREST